MSDDVPKTGQLYDPATNQVVVEIPLCGDIEFMEGDEIRRRYRFHDQELAIDNGGCRDGVHQQDPIQGPGAQGSYQAKQRRGNRRSAPSGARGLGASWIIPSACSVLHPSAEQTGCASSTSRIATLGRGEAAAGSVTAGSCPRAAGRAAADVAAIGLHAAFRARRATVSADPGTCAPIFAPCSSSAGCGICLPTALRTSQLLVQLATRGFTARSRWYTVCIGRGPP
jgi:hypothetical protein